MIRRIKSCQSCSKRFTTASGASLCLSCRKPCESAQSAASTDCKSSVIDPCNSVHQTSSSGSRNATLDCKPKASAVIDLSVDHDRLAVKYLSVESDFNSYIDSTVEQASAASGGSHKIATEQTKPTIYADSYVHSKRQGIEIDNSFQVGNKKPRVSYEPECKDDKYYQDSNQQNEDRATNNEQLFTRSFEEEEFEFRKDSDNTLERTNASVLTQFADDCEDTIVQRVASDAHNSSQCSDESSGDCLDTGCTNPTGAIVESSCDNLTTQEHTHAQLDREPYSNKKGSLGEFMLDESTNNFDYERADEVTEEIVLSEDEDSVIICWDASERDSFEFADKCDAQNHCTVDAQSASITTAAAAAQHTTDDVPKDVCYICGTDLSKLSTGIRGRVAHMKRCSAKNGKLITDNDDGDLVAAGEEDLAPKRPNPSDKVVFNPYSKDQWHGDASLDLVANISTPSAKQGQSTIEKFFKAPVRSLTNVLMAGSKRLAKAKSIEEKRKSDVAASKSRGKWGGGGSWRSQNRGSCPQYKKIPGTDFVCDGFHYASHALTSNYFLTHFHSDHYGGITKQWNEGIIYCSAPTANLVNQQLGVERRWLHPLPMNTPKVLESKGKPVTVTLLEANHCPGAVMFLFETGNKQILHVGDFRWNNSIMMAMPQLRAFSNMKPRLDEIFLDTTYCDPKYTLPTQDAAIAAAIKVVKDEMSTAKMMGTKSLLLFGSYTIGKEKIYLSVAEYLNTKVYVDKRRYRILSALEWPKERMNLFTTVKSESYLWVVPLGHVNFKKMPEYLEEGNKHKPAFAKQYGRVVGFRPTGWTYSASKKPSKAAGASPTKQKLISSKTNGRFSVHGVPYSEHSSFPELVDCLRCLKPKKITTTVSVSKSEEQCELLLNAVDSQD